MPRQIRTMKKKPRLSCIIVKFYKPRKLYCAIIYHNKLRDILLCRINKNILLRWKISLHSRNLNDYVIIQRIKSFQRFLIITIYNNLFLRYVYRYIYIFFFNSYITNSPDIFSLSMIVLNRKPRNLLGYTLLRISKRTNH